MPQASISMGTPAALVTQSMMVMTLCLAATAPSASPSDSTPVDVSEWTKARNLMSLSFASAASTMAGSTGVPHSKSSGTTTAPPREATSLMRMPKTPLRATRILSPGSTMLSTQASMPTLPGPATVKVASFFVLNSVCSIVFSSSIRPMKDGSRCPIVGCAIAASTSGATGEGPGPRSRRWGGRNGSVGKRFMMSPPDTVCF